MASRVGSRVVRGAREFGERRLEDKTEEIPVVPREPSLTEERQRVVRIARHQYAAQLLPWKVLAAALCAGLFVDSEDWSPWGALPWAIVITVASFLVTMWRLGGRHVKSGKIDWGNPRGHKQRRIRRRAVRSAAMGSCVGVWLIAVTLVDPGHASGKLVWLAGAAVWATFSYHGWWAPAETAYDTPAPPAEQDEPAAPDPGPGRATVPAADRTPRRAAPARGPRATAAQATAVARAEEERLVVPDSISLSTTVDEAVAAAAGNRDYSPEIRQVMVDHGLKGEIVEMQVGPAVTRYGIKPAPGQKVSAFKARTLDFQLACGTETLRILAPIEGHPLIGIEVPNENRTWCTVGEVLASPLMRDDPHPLLVALGKVGDGGYFVANLQDGPHFLVAGATNGGKSGSVNSMLVSILTRATPDEVRFLLIDPKRVELTRYQGVPHLITPVVTDASRAVAWLKWVVDEMNLRYEDMEHAGVRHIDDLNAKIVTGAYKPPPGSRRELRPYPYLLAVIDEYADLMAVATDEVEDAVIRIGQLARACGIHLVLATQRPSVDVVTGLIKANLPSRIAFKTASPHDSRTILDTIGAEKLLGKGDAFVKLEGMTVRIRIQGCWVSNEDVDAVVAAWRREVEQKNLIVPQVTLTTTVTAAQPAPRYTAYQQIVAKALSLADPHTRRVTWEEIVSATPGLGESARRNALTQAFNNGALRKIEGQQAVYLVPDPEDEPLEQEPGDTQ